MTARKLDSPPRILPLYARAAASLIPGASLLPFVPGRGNEIPDIELALENVRVDPERLAAYAKVCGFTLRDTLPATYPHVLAFPLHMAAMADGRFPFGAVGLVHIENRIVQRRAIAVGEQMEIRVRLSKLQAHPRGRTFALISEVLIGGEQVWVGISTMLRREGRAQSGRSSGTPEHSAPSGALSEWRLGEDLGRRYAAVSGDRNPIHMHSLTAKPLGFSRAIAHGMWTKARCLSALESRLPDALAVEVRFRKPILLPARVSFASSQAGEEIEFAVRDSKRDTVHLQGRLGPEQSNPGEESERA
jgi:acyl dehydratase